MASKRTLFNLKGPQLKSTGWLLLLALVGIILILIGGFLGRVGDNNTPGNALAVTDPVTTTAPPKATTVDATVLAAQERELALELERILARVSGAGKVDVGVTLSSTPVSQIGANVQSTEQQTSETDKQGGTRTITQRTTSSQPVILSQSSGGQALAVIATQRGAIAGVLVVAEGAGDSTVRSELTRACMTLLNLPAHRITVVKGKVGN